MFWAQGDPHENEFCNFHLPRNLAEDLVTNSFCLDSDKHLIMTPRNRREFRSC